LQAFLENLNAFKFSRWTFTPAFPAARQIADSFPSSIFINEFETRLFKCPSDGEVIGTRESCWPVGEFGAADRGHPNGGLPRQIFGIPTQKRPSGPNLAASQPITIHMDTYILYDMFHITRSPCSPNRILGAAKRGLGGKYTVSGVPHES
jgi:hypothetical protein